ncbi:hypothetical protein U4E84_16440 [Halorubrum sp. AD140]|uniref:DUF7856 family protein n=1 Tax=Halorubrum sp. AD140 TaxID=3050073 RepID=UPI002ACC91E2|nr:hypothetical protein [Halorubrum sp. AD140]MDZ5812930.1 hypothetical protein [Halorubrum sp. AD140]
MTDASGPAGSEREGGPESDGADRDEIPAADPIPRPADVLGRVPTGTSRRRELAAAARSLGIESSVRDELVELHEEIDRIEVDPVDLAPARRRVAAANGAEERLKERVAALRGEVRARRDVAADADAALADLEEAAAELASVQTERIAAEQALERARERAAAARDARERRLGLADRLRNRQREARRELAAAVYPSFRDALGSVPGGDPARAGSRPSAYDGAPLAASLAAVRIADLDGPVCLGADAARRFSERDWTAPEAALGVEVVLPDATPDR